MNLSNYQWQSPFAKKYVGIGREEGREEGRKEGFRAGREQGREEGREQGLLEGHAESLFHILEARGLPISASVRRRIVACTDMHTLDTWIRRAVTAADLRAIFDAD